MKKQSPKYLWLLFAFGIPVGCHIVSIFVIKIHQFQWLINPLSILIGYIFLSIELWGKIIDESVDGTTTIYPWVVAGIIIVIANVIIYNDTVFRKINNGILNNSYSYNYLLSSINQGLAALFALVFALLFTLTQVALITKAPNNRVGKIFSKYVLIYTISFVISIIAPLFLIGTDQILGIKIVLFFAVCNVAMLIPFFWRFKISTTRKKKRTPNLLKK